ncbi:hypothetical protein HD553DRAFT_341808 [Filobasidium floriforme]|uniref:uncharacterized protein n=1 Tax=Filobasidium floriforme TaxID=5210 RepID=UPI001E8EA64D|nr:uncharacterized protein HD553DRAFT_341808 [Filobasidium floriforme]KAH8085186.1 hypothetical protein HD553DRAFT_341808 [Filobasidium floriforme]
MARESSTERQMGKGPLTPSVNTVNAPTLINTPTPTKFAGPLSNNPTSGRLTPLRPVSFISKDDFKLFGNGIGLFHQSTPKHPSPLRSDIGSSPTSYPASLPTFNDKLDIRHHFNDKGEGNDKQDRNPEEDKTDHLLITRLLTDICLEQKGDTAFRALKIALKVVERNAWTLGVGAEDEWFVKACQIADGSRPREEKADRHETLSMQKRLYESFDNKWTEDEGSFEDLMKTVPFRVDHIVNTSLTRLRSQGRRMRSPLAAINPFCGSPESEAKDRTLDQAEETVLWAPGNTPWAKGPVERVFPEEEEEDDSKLNKGKGRAKRYDVKIADEPPQIIPNPHNFMDRDDYKHNELIYHQDGDRLLNDVFHRMAGPSRFAEAYIESVDSQDHERSLDEVMHQMIEHAKFMSLQGDAASLSNMDFTSIVDDNRDVQHCDFTKEYVDTLLFNPSPGSVKDTHVTCMANDAAEPLWLLDPAHQDATRPSNVPGQYSDDSVSVTINHQRYARQPEFKPRRRFAVDSVAACNFKA